MSGEGKQKLREEKEIFVIYDEYPLGGKDITSMKQE